MSSTISNPSATTEISSAILQSESSRCLHRFANGKRCRLRAESSSSLCAHHFRLSAIAAAPPASPNDAADLSADLLPDLSRLSSVDLRQFLARLLVLVTQGRISPRRAAVLSYITNQLLHSTSPAKPNRNANSCKSYLARLAQEVLEGTSP
jgi:hypothetical protein